MMNCIFCGAQIHAEGDLWVDNSGGDVCGTHGTNHPHVPRTDEVDEGLMELVHDQASQLASNVVNSSEEVEWLVANGWTADDIVKGLKGKEHSEFSDPQSQND